MNEPCHPLKGALWAPVHSEHRPPIGVFIAAGKGYKGEKNPQPNMGDAQFPVKTAAARDDE
ncbi:hypothetical protein [Caballeronia sp. LjRoot31]|jgi:hypothetical protein|uniref:hypothetical protein n=1 Tax=Caballeronia sp. LjRoot31 TaxID=3342324 RepID=UPI003ECD2747